MPSAWAATPMRPPSSVDIAILKPSPSSPSRFSAPTRQSSRNTWVVAEARMPSFFSFAPVRSPQASDGTRKAAERPSVAAVLSRAANTR